MSKKQNNIRIFVLEKKTGERYEINDLYWFEENFVHWFDDTGYREYSFEIYVNGKKVYSSS